MSVQLEQKADRSIIEVEATGKLTKEDYEQFVPVLEERIREVGKIRILFIIRDFHGWKAGALWDDLQFDWKHYADIEKLAIVGDKAWEKGMAVFCKPFTTAAIRFFPLDQVEVARQWLTAD